MQLIFFLFSINVTLHENKRFSNKRGRKIYLSRPTFAKSIQRMQMENDRFQRVDNEVAYQLIADTIERKKRK